MKAQPQHEKEIEQVEYILENRVHNDTLMSSHTYTHMERAKDSPKGRMKMSAHENSKWMNMAGGEREAKRGKRVAGLVNRHINTFVCVVGSVIIVKKIVHAIRLQNTLANAFYLRVLGLMFYCMHTTVSEFVCECVYSTRIHTVFLCPFWVLLECTTLCLYVCASVRILWNHTLVGITATQFAVRVLILNENDVAVFVSPVCARTAENIKYSLTHSHTYTQPA